MRAALGIDVGTTNAKAVLVDGEGRLLASAVRPIATRRLGDRASQDADAVWSAVRGAVRVVTTAAPAAANAVEAVLCASQYSSIVPVGGGGRPSAPMLLYLDKAGTDHSFAVMERHTDAFELFLGRHGIPPIGGGLSLAHLLHLQLDRPEVHAATDVYLEPMDFVNLRLTGRAAATQCTMLMSQLCDNRTQGATEYDAQLLDRSGVDSSRLPPLIAIDAAVGELLPEVAADLGLGPRALVYAGVNDSQAGVIATGAFAAGRGGVMIGTTSVLLETTDHLASDLDHEIVATPGPLPGCYVVFAENGLGGKALEHVLANVVYASDELADHLAGDHYEHLDAALGAAPAGSGGVLFCPWLAGTLSPAADPSVRGAFLNLSLDTRRTDLVRAVVEGICHNLAWLVPHVVAFTGAALHEVVFCGGAARSAQWAQTLADVLARPVRVVRDPELAVARAAALLALQRAGRLTESDLLALVDPAAVYEPRPELRDRYDAMQAQFQAAFSALQPISHALREAVEQR
ncbi:MAG: sugar kinase [Acidimicrobiia bacterium]